MDEFMSSLRVYYEARALVRICRSHWEAIARVDREHAAQLRRAVKAVPANIAEAEHRHDGNGRQRLETALGEARETRCHLECAADSGYLDDETTAAAIRQADKVAAMLYRLRRARGAA